MPAGITIVGLGPGDPRLLTVEAYELLLAAPEVFARTRIHPVFEGTRLAEELGDRLHSFDELYEQNETFEEVYAAIVAQVLALGARTDGVLYAVPGDPLLGEATVQHLLRQVPQHDLSMRIVHGISFVEPTLAALGIDAFDGLQICDATLLSQRHHPPLDPDVPALIVQVYNQQLASDAKLTLMAVYPDEHPVRLVYHAGLVDQAVHDLPLYQLDRQTCLDHLSSLYVPPLAVPGSLSSYQEVMARLRAPDGCPWDREQTHESLRTYLLEETYEVLAALDAGDTQELCEELGDLLLQILFHAQIAEESGEFRLSDSIAYAIAKLVRRHPHVFADVEAQSPEQVLQNWEQIKRQERIDNGQGRRSMLDGLNQALPALAQALKIQERVARVGFDWTDEAQVRAKLDEELAEFAAAPDSAAQARELGDVLFALVNIARWHGIDAEDALREANARFGRRFRAIEAYAVQAGRDVASLSPAEMDAIWEQAKANEHL
ncbi:MAG: nucleoside triphosphate pyrophosphohydrolase [Anaerolineales bacterium]